MGSSLRTAVGGFIAGFIGGFVGILTIHVFATREAYRERRHPGHEDHAWS